ncbi:SagB/ThcOx family dehydrogenase [Anoxybacillus flavithermus]
MNHKVVRLSNNLVFYWENEHFICDNYFLQKAKSLNKDLFPILDWFAAPKSTSTLSELINTKGISFNEEEMNYIVEQLIESSILVEEGSEMDKLEKKYSSWDRWGKLVSYYHFGSRVTFKQKLISSEDDKLKLIEKAKKFPPPSMYKEIKNCKRIPLEIPRGLRNKNTFEHVILNRKTTREFSNKKISKQEFSDILFYTFGAIACNLDEGYGPFLYKTSPSGGARHPIEVYPIVLNVEGIEPGIYHYSVKNHDLELIRMGDEKYLRNLCKSIGKDQEHVGKPSVVFVYTALIDREMWKYESPRAYRVIMYDLGHLSQTLYLMSSYFNLGAFFTGAINDEVVDSELNLDTSNEIPLGLSGVGHILGKNLER